MLTNLKDDQWGLASVLLWGGVHWIRVLSKQVQGADLGTKVVLIMGVVRSLPFAPFCWPPCYACCLGLERALYQSMAHKSPTES
jgi:hypothetical protein